MEASDRNHKRVWTGITILWMIVIFVMSSRNSELSSADSGSVSFLILRLFYPGFMELPEAAKEALLLSISYPVRKCAHATEYAILGVLLCKRLSMEKWGAALLFAALYAVTDEVHQYFVPGRSCQITDMLIDTAGAAAGILLFCGALYLRRRQNRSQKERR